MDFIEKNLIPGEQLVYRTKLHWNVFLYPLFLLILILFFTGRYRPVLIFIPIIWGIVVLIEYRTSEFGVTNKRVLIKTGAFSKTSVEILLNKVEGIHVKQSFLGNMLDYGTIDVKGTGGTVNSFPNITMPLEFRKKVQEQVDSKSSSEITP